MITLVPIIIAMVFVSVYLADVKHIHTKTQRGVSDNMERGCLHW